MIYTKMSFLSFILAFAQIFRNKEQDTYSTWRIHHRKVGRPLDGCFLGGKLKLMVQWTNKPQRTWEFPDIDPLVSKIQNVSGRILAPHDGLNGWPGTSYVMVIENTPSPWRIVLGTTQLTDRRNFTASLNGSDPNPVLTEPLADPPSLGFPSKVFLTHGFGRVPGLTPQFFYGHRKNWVDVILMFFLLG